MLRIKQLDKTIRQCENELDKLRKSSSIIESDIKRLQDKILEVGGVRLRSQNAKVDSVQTQIDMVSDRLTKTAAEKTTRERNLAKVNKSIEKKKAELDQTVEEVTGIEKELQSQSAVAAQLRRRVEEEKQVEEEKLHFFSLVVNLKSKLFRTIRN